MAKQSFVPSSVKIKVIGVGGGGCNAVTRMVRQQIRGVEFIAMNTDAQHLAVTEAPIRLQLGDRVTRGLGAGGDHTMGRKAADESRDEIKELIAGSDMVFVTGGMGGGTGTGASPIVAEVAKQTGALTIGIVTKPFTFEGRHRCEVAEEGISNLIKKVDTLIIIPNDRLLALCDKRTSVDSAFQFADDVLRQGIQSISEVITVPGLINLDFADVRAIMKESGPAWMSIGVGTGANRAADAAKAALASPLLDVSINGARGVLFNVVGGSSLTLLEVNEAAEVIRRAVDPEANIIFGVVHDDTMDHEVRITLVATGFVTQGGVLTWEREDEVNKLLLGLRDNEDKLDAPSFLRHPRFAIRRAMPLPAEPEKAPSSSIIE
ncbi:MAG: cell division protein FtsZ [Chloroflexota bacterium]